MSFFADFITGVCVGIEFYSGEDAMEGDKFAVTLDLFIIRFTFIIHDQES